MTTTPHQNGIKLGLAIGVAAAGIAVVVAVGLSDADADDGRRPIDDLSYADSYATAEPVELLAIEPGAREAFDLVLDDIDVSPDVLRALAHGSDEDVAVHLSVDGAETCMIVTRLDHVAAACSSPDVPTPLALRMMSGPGNFVDVYLLPDGQELTPRENWPDGTVSGALVVVDPTSYINAEVAADISVSTTAWALPPINHDDHTLGEER